MIWGLDGVLQSHVLLSPGHSADAEYVWPPTSVHVHVTVVDAVLFLCLNFCETITPEPFEAEVTFTSTSVPFGSFSVSIFSPLN